VLQAFKVVVHLKKKNFLIIYSPPCHPKCPCLSFLSQKEIEVFDENIPGFSPYNGLHGGFIVFQTVQGPNESFSAASKGFNRHQTTNKGLI